eukprot:g8623.t1
MDSGGKRGRGRPRKHPVESSSDASARSKSSSTIPSRQLSSFTNAARPSTLDTTGGTSRGPRRHSEVHPNNAGDDDGGGVRAPSGRRLRRRIIDDVDDAVPAAAAAASAQATVQASCVDDSQRRLPVSNPSAAAASGRARKGGSGSSGRDRLHEGDAGSGRGDVPTHGGGADDGRRRGAGRPVTQPVFDPCTGTYTDNLISAAGGNPTDFSITVTNAASGNVPQDAFDNVYAYYRDWSDRCVVSQEREEQGNLHLQIVATMAMMKTLDRKRLTAALRKHLRDHARLGGREKYKIIIKPLEGKQTWDGMVGYVLKDDVRSHFRTARKNVSREEANTALRDNRQRQRRMVKENRTEIGKKNIWSSTAAMEAVRADAFWVAILTPALFTRQHSYILFFSGGQGGRVSTSFALWDMIDGEFEDLSRESSAREVATFTMEPPGVLRYAVDADSDVEGATSSHSAPTPPASRRMDLFASFGRSTSETSPNADDMPLVVHPRCVEPGCSSEGNLCMLQCDVCEGDPSQLPARGRDSKSNRPTPVQPPPMKTTRQAAGAAQQAVMAVIGATTAAAIVLVFLLSPETVAQTIDSGAAAGCARVEGGGAVAEAFDTVLMVDAGSSGSRLNVYRLDREGESFNLSGTAAGKIEPGLSSFAESPAGAGEHILPLLAKASNLVPSEKHSTTKVFIKSTAGMRLLPTETQEAIYDSIYEALVGNPSLFPFALDRGGVGTIDGEMEAFYAVLSANFLAGRIDARMHPTGHGSGEIGALDMGGASTQIVFRHEVSDYDGPETGVVALSDPTASTTIKDGDGHCDNANNSHVASDSGLEAELATHVNDNEEGGEGGDDDRRHFREQERGPGVSSVPVSQSDFWGASHLGYGAAEVRLRIWDYLVETQSDQPDMPAASAATGHSGDPIVVANPCSFVGRVDEWKGHRLVGSGDHVVCEKVVAAVLWGRGDGTEESGELCGVVTEAEQRPCGVAGVSMPPLRGDFLAMSVFFYAMHALHALGPAELLAWPKPTLAELREAAGGFCAMGWAALEDRKDTLMAEDDMFITSEEGLPHRCVEVVYMITLLRDGYGFPEHSRNVTYALEADGMELEWTLGYALVELARSTENVEDTNATKRERVATGCGCGGTPEARQG